MNKAIVVSGTPGSGKSTLAQKIAKKTGYTYIDVNKLIKKNNLSEGYDRKRKCKIIDTKKLNKELTKLIKHDSHLIIDSHLAHQLSPKSVKLCAITRCGLKTLKQRLKKRGYNPIKIRENIDCEIFEVCLLEAKEAGHKIIEVWTDKKVDYDTIMKKIKN